LKRFLRHLYRPSAKEDFRKFGINLMTASAVGQFINHFADHKATFSIVGVGLAGMFIWLFGIYKEKMRNKND
jgi:hypothetical protein